MSAAGFYLLLGLTRQAVPEVRLPAATVEFPEGFTTITAVRELRDGRVIVSDIKDGVVRLVDLLQGTASAIGRQGAGPGEYRRPGRLIALNGDSTLLVDAGLQRSTVLLPTGTPGAELLGAGARADAPVQARTPLAVDRLGRLYYQGSGLDMSARTPMVADSVWLLRYSPATGQIDSLARLLAPWRDLRIQRNGATIRSVNILVFPFQPQDDWELLPDGRLLIARSGEFHLESLDSSGRVTRGPRIPYRPIALTSRERDAMAGSSRIPSYKPPFDAGSVRAAPDGRLWIRRTTAEADSTARYEVFDGSGHLVGRVSLAPRTTVVGFGRGVVFVSRRDEDDLEHLGRVPRPAFQ